MARGPGSGVRRPEQSSERAGTMMTPLADLEEFITDHRPHGTLTGDATEPTWNGYLPHRGLPVRGGV